MKRLKLAYGLLIGTMLGSAACEDLQACEDGWCLNIDICNPVTENCGEADTDAEDPCPDGEVVDSSDNCLMDDAFCYELPDGSWCTGPDAPVCADGVIVDSSDNCLMDDAFCYELSDGSWCTGPDAPVLTV